MANSKQPMAPSKHAALIISSLLDEHEPAMIRLTELKLPLSALPVVNRRAADALPETDADRLPDPHPVAALRQLCAIALQIRPEDIADLHVFKRSFDARKAALLAVYIVDMTLVDAALEAAVLARHPSHPHILRTPDMIYQPVAQAPARLPLRPVVVGFGPCGMFAALLLAQMGFKPIVLERGRKVRERTQDTWGLWRKHVLNPESNVQFGEGGAGTFSDGKLWSQIKDPRHLGRKVMEEFVKAGAPPEILVEAHPHIGTFKLVRVVERLREQIIALGGEVRFEQRVIDIQVEGAPDARQVRGLTVLNQASGQTEVLRADQVVLALGHSARDTFAMLHDRGVALQTKAFSVGFRIEHPQSVIDRALWGRHAGNPLLGAAAYKLVHHAQNGRAVYSFCMCPGGTVVAATSEPGRVVTNGMSQYSRNERNANAGLVVGIEPADYPQDAASFIEAFGPLAGAVYAQEAIESRATNAQATHPLAGINLQRQLETQAFVLGGGNYEAPGQLVADFIHDTASTSLGQVLPSYQPGVKLGSLHLALPGYAIAALREALPAFGKKIRGFDMPDALLTGVETRTSSPLRMPRGDDFQSINTAGLYPGGEGAGYAGGILSAGVDGIRLAEAVAQQIGF
jgi:uncharacterized FAD-dependent dehydrogenase